MNTTSIVTATADTITGLSGKTLKVSNFMKTNNLSSEYRLGLKNFSDLYSSRVRDKILGDSKLKNWDEYNKKALADVARELMEFDAKNSSRQSHLVDLIDLISQIFLRSSHSELQGQVGERKLGCNKRISQQL
jgi:hypothetical protein